MTRPLPWHLLDEELKHRYMAGDSLESIGAAFGCSARTIWTRVRKLELPPRPLPTPDHQKGVPRGVMGLPPDRDESAHRRCLTCRQMFMSAHRGNRICDRCKPIVANASGGIDAVTY